MSLAIAGFGGIFVWSALRHKSWSEVLRHVISGGPLTTLNNANVIHPLIETNASTGETQIVSAVNGTGNAIADVALSYQEHCYNYGGSPGRNGNGCWDCSSFVNWVLGHDLGQQIPGQNGYDGTSHGPTTLSYISWRKPQTVYVGRPSGAAAIAQPGDIVVDAVHMGIAVGRGLMVSALNPSLGTKVTTIQSVMIAPTFVKRL